MADIYNEDSFASELAEVVQLDIIPFAHDWRFSKDCSLRDVNDSHPIENKY